MYVLICYSLTGLIKGSIHPAINIITYYLLLITYLELIDSRQIDRQKDKQVDRQKDKQVDRQKDTHRQIDNLKQVITWTFGTEQIKMEYQIQSLQILGRQIDRQKDTQVNRQIDRKIDIYK